MAANTDRLTNLEVKVAFIEQTLADLDSVIRELSRQADQLRREVDHLNARTGARAAAPSPPEEEMSEYE